MTDLPWLQIVLSILTAIIGLYFAWDSNKNGKKFNLFLAFLMVIIGGYSSYTSIKSGLELNNTIDNITKHDKLSKLGDLAFSGDRNAYLKLQKIATSTFGERRNAAIVEIENVNNRYSKYIHLNDIELKDSNINESITKNEISTKSLISILLLHNSHLHRARSAQLLANRNEEYVHEALLLSIFTEDNLLAQQSSIRAFEKLVGYNSIYILNPYDDLGYWYDNKNKIKLSLTKHNDVSIIPIDRFMPILISKINDSNLDKDKNEIRYWYRVGIELCSMIKNKKTIEPNNWR